MFVVRVVKQYDNAGWVNETIKIYGRVDGA
jgi:hypothetical protein